MKAIIAVSLITLLILWLSADFYFGKKKHRATVKNVRLPERQSDFELFTKGEELINQFFYDLQKAKKYIHIQFFIFKNDKISMQLSDLLRKKAEQGVEVRLLLDWVGSSSFPVNVRDDLKKSGAKFFFSSKPKWPYLFYSLQRRNHRKISIIDGQIGYMGGFNIGKEYIDGDKKLTPWHDYHLRIKGEGVQDLERVFLDDWRLATGEEVQYEDVFITPSFKGQALHRFFYSDGAFLEEEYIALFQQAKNAITIASPYFVPSDNLVQELINCLQHGVSVTIIVPFNSDHFLVKEASFPYFRKLISAGAQVYQYQKGFFHGKYLMIDQTLADIGTANFDKRSLFLNSEINCYIYDQHFIQNMLKEMQKDIENSHLLSLDDLKNNGIWSKTKEWMAICLSYFL